MEKWIFTSSTTLEFILISALGIYITIILLTRIFGKRSFSKMSSFDFACTIAIGSIIASTLLSKSVSLIEGGFGLCLIYLFQGITSYLRRFQFFEKIVDNTPIYLMKDGKLISKNLKKANVTVSDLRGKLREANVLKLTEVKAVVFETTGDISVLHSTENKEVDNWILEDIGK